MRTHAEPFASDATTGVAGILGEATWPVALLAEPLAFIMFLLALLLRLPPLPNPKAWLSDDAWNLPQSPSPPHPISKTCFAQRLLPQKSVELNTSQRITDYVRLHGDQRFLGTMSSRTRSHVVGVPLGRESSTHKHGTGRPQPERAN